MSLVLLEHSVRQPVFLMGITATGFPMEHVNHAICVGATEIRSIRDVRLNYVVKANLEVYILYKAAFTQAKQSQTGMCA